MGRNDSRDEACRQDTDLFDGFISLSPMPKSLAIKQGIPSFLFQLDFKNILTPFFILASNFSFTRLTHAKLLF